MTYKRHTNGGWIGPVRAKPADIASPGVWSLDDFRSRLRGTNDPNYASNVLLVQFNGPPNTLMLAATVPDYSTYAHAVNVANVNFNGNFPRFTETAPNVEANTAAAEFSSSSTTLLNWSAAGTEFTFGTGDFTIEFWLYPTSTNIASLLDMRPDLTNGPHFSAYIDTGGSLNVAVNSVTTISSSTGVIAANTYQHIAFARVSGTTRQFVNGTQQGSSWADSTNYTSTRLLLGQTAFGTAALGGYIDSLRMAKGLGRYSANFTAPTLPFPNFGPT